MEVSDGLPRKESSAVTARSLARSQSRAIDRLETPPSDDGSEDFSPYAEAPPQIMLRMSEGGKHNRGGFEVYPPLATVPASFMAESKPVWIHPNTLQSLSPDLQVEYAERNEEMERHYHYLMHGGTVDAAAAAIAAERRNKSPGSKGAAVQGSVYWRMRQEAEKAVARARAATGGDPAARASEEAAKRRLITRRKNQVEREIANIRVLRINDMEKLLHKVNSLPDVKGDPLPLAQLFLARGLYYAALNVSASQQAALRTIAEDIEARLTATETADWFWQDADRDLLIANSSAAPLFVDPKHVAKYREGMKDVVLGPAPSVVRKIKSNQRLQGRSPGRSRRTPSGTPGSSRESTPQSASVSVGRASSSRAQLGKQSGEKPDAIEEAAAEGAEPRRGEEEASTSQAGASEQPPAKAAAAAAAAAAPPKSAGGPKRAGAGALRPGGGVTFDSAAAAGAAPHGDRPAAERSVLDDFARQELERFHTITALDMELLNGIVKELLHSGAGLQVESSRMGSLAAMARRAAEAASRAAESAASVHAEVEEYQASKATVPHDLGELLKIPKVKMLQSATKATADALIARGVGRSKSGKSLGAVEADDAASRRSRSSSKSPSGGRRSRSPVRVPSGPGAKLALAQRRWSPSPTRAAGAKKAGAAAGAGGAAGAGKGGGGVKKGAAKPASPAKKVGGSRPAGAPKRTLTILHDGDEQQRSAEAAAASDGGGAAAAAGGGEEDVGAAGG